MYITHGNATYSNVQVYSNVFFVRFSGESLTGLTELTGEVKVFADNGFELRSLLTGDFLRQEITDGSWLLTNAPLPTPKPVAPVEYDLLTSTANMTKMLMNGAKPTTADEVIMCSALYDEWKAGKHEVGEIFTLDGAPWEVYKPYDNAEYPDIVPGNIAWPTFNRPFHGKTRETAREFVHPTCAEDQYKKGEWAIQGGKFTECLMDTSYSMEEYPAAWKVRE